MAKIPQKYSDELVAALKNGAIGVLRTDTIYGIVASAYDRTSVERVYEIRGRAPNKPCIILISDYEQLLTPPPESVRAKLKAYWPGQVSIILPVDKSVPEWLHRGAQTLAYRMVADKDLCDLLRKTGPLIAPSANPEGKSPARSVQEAREYFGDEVDFYIDGGLVPEDVQPSRLMRIDNDGTFETLR